MSWGPFCESVSGGPNSTSGSGSDSSWWGNSFPVSSEEKLGGCGSRSAFKVDFGFIG